MRAGVDYIGHANYLDVKPSNCWRATRNASCRPGDSVGSAVSRAMRKSWGQPSHRARSRLRSGIDATITSVAKLRAAGVRLVVGGDYGISIAPHGTYAKDLEYFVDLFGMTNAEALLCATRNGGLAMDRSGRLGTLTAGSVADFLIVDGDPLHDIKVLQDHARLRIVKSGRSV
ncbi:MAG: amidohydrolase family protein [Gammaproteobacteria bacterium]|nr:amidohydrolase family protein [Gammaproteobacteria bacterium]